MDTEKLENPNAFPITRWSVVAALKGDAPAALQEALNYIAQRYWKPVYLFVRQRGYEEEHAKDLVQEFFMRALSNDLFAKADPGKDGKGRFRNFLLGSLKNFLANAHRDAHAQKRHPSQGFVAINEMETESGPVVVPKDTKTPDEAFHRNWLHELVLKVLRALEMECEISGKQAHFELFRQRLIAPMLEGSEVPSLQQLAERFELNVKAVDGRVVRLRRDYQRLMREEIRRYATSDQDVAAEIQDLWRFMAE